MLEGVRTSLEASPAFEVIALGAAHAAEQDLLRLRPDVIIFDTASVQPQFHYNLIQQRSRLQLIGINPDRDQVLLWSGQQLHELSVKDLVEVIYKGRCGEAERGRHGDGEKISVSPCHSFPMSPRLLSNKKSQPFLFLRKNWLFVRLFSTVEWGPTLSAVFPKTDLQ